MEAPVAEPPPKFRPEKFRGLKYEVNTAYKIMEENLGIKFKTPPRKAHVRSKQDLAHFLHEGDTAIGVYHFDTNTFYHWGDSISDQLHLDNFFIELHENAHAYIEQESFEMRTDDFESVLLKLALHEGMADWMAVETMARLDPASSEDLNPYHYGAINSQPPGAKSRSVDENGINLAIQEFYAILAKHRKQQTPMTGANFREMRKQVEGAAHALGHYYVDHHMNRLLANGLGTADALRVIIKNPPVRIEQLLGSRFFPLVKKR